MAGSSDNCPVIGLDLDEVCADFVGGFNRRAYEVLGPSIIRTDKDYRWPCWEIVDALNISDQQEHEVWNDIMTRGGFWEHLPVLPGVTKALRTLQTYEANGLLRLVFITARPEVSGNGTYIETMNWLYRTAWVEDPYVIIAHNKGAVAQAVGLTHFVDDKFQNCVEIRKWMPTSQVYFVRCPHGEKYVPEAHGHGVTVINNLPEFVALITDEVLERKLA